MVTSVYFRQKATQCRRLSSGISSADPTALALQALAEEFDHKAVALEAEMADTLLIGFGDHSKSQMNGQRQGGPNGK